MQSTYMVQGVPFEKSQKKMAVALKLSIFQPHVGKAKMRLRGDIFLKNCGQIFSN